MYTFLAHQLLDYEDYTLLETRSGEIGFTRRLNYSGLMAQPSRTGANRGVVKRRKQGYFDFFVNTGDIFGNSGATHKDIFYALTNNSTLKKCFDVWRGENPISLTTNRFEQEILSVLLLFFFEQEINWGNEEWQRYTYFAPKVLTPTRVRPRDMLMGYISQAFDLGVENVAFWMTSRPTTTTFISPDRTNFGFEDYPDKYKRYFLDLQNDEAARALMVGEMRSRFRDVVNAAPDNPFY